jgi:predicted glycosyltransferase
MGEEAEKKEIASRAESVPPHDLSRVARVIWIDLENSPHVLFFQPLISWLGGLGHHILLTARDISQTLELLRLHGLDHVTIGGHGGGGRFAKGLRQVGRALRLMGWARSRKISLSIGHGSRAQALASALLGIPCLTFIDYEYVSMRLFGLCCKKVFVPEAVPLDVLSRRGVPASRIKAYPGFKEQLYIDPSVRGPEPESPPLILVRPPARRAHYHTHLSDRLYTRLLDRFIQEASRCRVLLLPRYADDTPGLLALADRHSHVEVLREATSGVELLRRASLVVSGGGTMIREAAVLGIPAASFFGGPVGGVDAALSRLGRLRMLRSEADVDGLAIPGGPSGENGTRPDSGENPGPLPDPSSMREFLKHEIAMWL